MSTKAIYSSQIIKASALIPDTHILLAHWNFGRSAEDNLRDARDNNIFAKASRARVEDILTAFRRRYFQDPAVGEALAVFARAPGHSQILDRLLYFYSARADRLLYDIVTQVLAQKHQSGFNDLSPIELRLTIQEWVNEGKTARRWNEETTERVTQGAMATLRDFGVLEGKVNKRIANIVLPVEAFAFIAAALSREGASGNALVEHPDWRLFFLGETAVERMFIEAHQRHYLEYHAAGRVTRITIPGDNLKEVARALVG